MNNIKKSFKNRLDFTRPYATIRARYPKRICLTALALLCQEHGIMALDFQEIRQNALKEGISLDEVRIIFEALDADTVETLRRGGVNVQLLGDGKVMTGMLESKYDYLETLATSVLKLSAD